MQLPSSFCSLEGLTKLGFDVLKFYIGDRKRGVNHIFSIFSQIAALVDTIRTLPSLAKKRPQFSSYDANQKGDSALLDHNQVDTIISSRRVFEFYNGQAARLKKRQILAFILCFCRLPTE